MPEEKFKLPTSSYEEVCKIIAAYGASEKSVSLEEVTRSSGVPRTVVSGNNGFLVSAGIIEGGKTKAPTRAGMTLARVLGYGMPTETQRAWREIVQGNDFMQKMLTALRIRRGMDVVTFQGHIAYSAGERKTGRTMTGARAVIDILRAAGLVEEEKDGRLVPAVTPGQELEEPTSPPPHIPSPPQPLTTQVAAVGTSQSAISVHIELRIDAKPSELEGLGSKLRQILEEVTGRPPTESESPPESQ